MKRRAKFFFKNIDAQIGYFVPFFSHDGYVELLW